MFINQVFPYNAMRFWSRITALAAAWTLWGCEEPKPSACDFYSGEFAAEQRSLCEATEDLTSFNGSTTLEQICDAADFVQDTVAAAFLDHGWRPTKDYDSPIHNSQYNDRVSPVYEPSSSPGAGGVMQCYFRHYPDEDKPRDVMGCTLLNRGNPTLPLTWFDLVTRGFIESLTAGYQDNTGKSTFFVEVHGELWYGHAGERVSYSFSDDRGEIQSQQLCYDAQDRFMKRGNLLQEFAQERLSE